MADKLDNELDEAKATGVNANSADAVVPAGGAPKNRNGDLKKQVDPKADEIEDDVKTPQGSNNAGVHESVDAIEGIFEGVELSEELKSKTVAIFEASVNEKVSTIREALETEFAEKTEAAISEMVEKLDGYLDYVVEQWVEENAVAIESSIKVEVAESFMNDLKSLINEHNLDIEQETVDIVSESKEALEEATDKYNEAIHEILALREQNESLAREISFRELSEGLTDTQVAKLRTLSEDISFDGNDEYATKISAIREQFFAEAVASATDETEFLEEEVKTEVKESLDTAMSAYASALNRFAK